MKYRVNRAEFITNRPFWLTKVLLQIPSICYSHVLTKEEAVANLDIIKQSLNASPAKRKGTVIHCEVNHIMIKNAKGKQYCTFFISEEDC